MFLKVCSCFYKLTNFIVKNFNIFTSKEQKFDLIDYHLTVDAIPFFLPELQLESLIWIFLTESNVNM